MHTPGDVNPGGGTSCDLRVEGIDEISGKQAFKALLAFGVGLDQLVIVGEVHRDGAEGAHPAIDAQRWIEKRIKRNARELVASWATLDGACELGPVIDGNLRIVRGGLDPNDSVIVTGASTSGCVRATVVDALQHGYRPLVPREAVGDRNPEAHDANLYDVDAKYGDVVSLDEALDYLEELAAAHAR
jgi:hypothetical protein